MCLVTQLCAILCDPVAHQTLLSMGILQARMLGWVAMSSSKGSFQPRSPTVQVDCLPSEPPGKPIYISLYFCLVAQSCLTLCNPIHCSPPGSSVQGDSPGKNTGVGCHALLCPIEGWHDPVKLYLYYCCWTHPFLIKMFVKSPL